MKRFIVTDVNGSKVGNMNKKEFLEFANEILCEVLDFKITGYTEAVEYLADYDYEIEILVESKEMQNLVKKRFPHLMPPR